MDVLDVDNYMEFGYWERNALGLLEYISLSQKLEIELIEDEQIWNIISLDGWILFQSLRLSEKYLPFLSSFLC